MIRPIIHRFAIALGLLSAFGVFANTTQKPATGSSVGNQSLPPGSYQRTCKDTHYNGATLVAKCMDGANNYHAASIDLQQKPCSADIENQGGRLVCASEAKKWSALAVQNQPRQLAAKASSDHQPQAVATKPNWDHRPSVAAAPRPAGLPPGGYYNSCKDIQYRVDQLQAHCLNKDGRYVLSWVVIPPGQCKGGFENRDGQLVCMGAPSTDSDAVVEEYAEPNDAGAPVAKRAKTEQPWGKPKKGYPLGNYAQTCIGVRMTTSPVKKLVGKCPDQNGIHRSAEIALPCAGNINNENGALVCKIK